MRLSGASITRLPSVSLSVTAEGDAPVASASDARSCAPTASGGASGAPPRSARTSPTTNTTSAADCSTRSQASGRRSVLPGIRR